VFPFLLFRGCDIKDLHVHENSSAGTASAVIPAPVSTNPNLASTKGDEAVSNPVNDRTSQPTTQAPVETKPQPPRSSISSSSASALVSNTDRAEPAKSESKTDMSNSKGRSNKDRGGDTKRTQQANTSSSNRRTMVGSGASLLTLKSRGIVAGVEGIFP
jgi:hypothetical protein